VGGPLIASDPGWSVQGIDADTVETGMPAGWIVQTQLVHLVRDRAGKVAALEVSTGRIKKMRFERQA
jgi:D-aminopeptidase